MVELKTFLMGLKKGVSKEEKKMSMFPHQVKSHFVS
jgi:hypothetical protein